MHFWCLFWVTGATEACSYVITLLLRTETPTILQGFPGDDASGKEPACQCKRRCFDP